MGHGHIGTLLQVAEKRESLRVVAVRDVYQKRRNGAGSWARARTYSVYRKRPKDRDVDAVCVVTSDHWHAPIALDATETGKNVDCLDWDMWLGHRFGLAPKCLWNPSRFSVFQIFWDYSVGLATDWFPHMLTLLVHVLNLTSPCRGTASGGTYLPEDRLRSEAPCIFQMSLKYRDGFCMQLIACLGNDGHLSMMIRGQRAPLVIEGDGATLYPQTQVAGQKRVTYIRRQRAGSLQEHWQNFSLHPD